MAKKPSNKVQRTFAIGDIHGYWKHLQALLKFINYSQSTDRLIFLGDYIDRGDNPKKTLDIVMKLQKESLFTICLMGNHEDIMLSNIKEDRRHSKGIWLSNGCEATLSSLGLSLYTNLDKIDSEYIQFLESLKQIFIDEELKMVFAHAGVDPLKSVYEQDCFDVFRGPMWIRPDFYNNKNPAPGYRVIFGHTPVYNIKPGLESVFWDKTKIGIETGIAYGKKLTALQIIPGKKLKAFYVNKNFETSIEEEP
jgi:serine/threonine protein phosphatase 1